MSSSVQANNKTKNILVVGKDFIQGLDNTTIYAEKLYSINFKKTNQTFCLSLHYNETNSYLFVSGPKIIKFEAKDSDIVATPLCLGNILKDFSVDNMKETGLNGYVYDFSANNDGIAVDDILDVHKYLTEKNNIKMLGFIKKNFFTAMTFFSFNALNVNPLECISMNNEEFKIRSEIIIVKTNEPIFYPHSITIKKCKGSCNTINDPYTKLCVPDTIKNINVKVFNLVSRSNETRHIEWHKTCKCKCRLDSSVCNNEEKWNEDKCLCECKELIDKGMCDKGYIWNPSNCECECDKSCDVGEYLDYKSCKCRNKIVDKLLEECSENIDGNEMLYKETMNIIPLDAIP